MSEVVTPAVMCTPGEIADRDGVTKQSVTKKARELAADGLQVERDERGRITRINVAQYDQLRGRTDDPSKAQRPAPQSETPAVDPNSYDEALRKKTWYEAERKRLDLEQEFGNLIRVDELAIAVDECGAEIVATIRQLQNETDTIAATVARDGASGLRVLLKSIETRMLTDISASLDRLANNKPSDAGQGATEIA